jgi:hypothetical protein
MAPTDRSAALVAAMLEAFGTAAARDPAGAPAEAYRFVGRPVRMRVAGSRLARTIGGAFTHLRSERAAASAETALTISLWDGEETGVAPPLRYLRDVFDRARPFGLSLVAVSSDERVVGLQSGAATTIYCRDSRHIVGWIESAASLSPFERGKPLQPLLFAWQSDLRIVPVHAGLVARQGRGILLGGPGGSGKTTTSLLCLAAGFDYLGDDYIAVPPPGNRWPQGFSVFASAWLEPAHARNFGWLLEHAVGEPGEDKRLVALSEVAGVRLGESADIVALVLPRVAGTPRTSYHPATKGEAFRRLAPSSILQLPLVAPRRALERMAAVTSRLPTYWLDLGQDLAEIPLRVGDILAEATSSDPGVATRVDERR